MPEQPTSVDIFLPAGETRQVQTPHARVLEDIVVNGWRQLTLQLQA
jgi:alpha-glucosidase